MPKRSFLAWCLFAVIIILIGIILWKLILKDSKTTVVNNDSTPVITQVEASDLSQKIDEPLFSLMLPRDWEQYQKTSKPHAHYFRSTKENEDDRTLVLYINSNTDHITLNKLIPVTAQNDRLTVGAMSEDCANFVESGGVNRPSEDRVVEWQSIKFVCDLSHINRNAMGVSARGEAMNSVTVGNNKFFFLFTDHNHRPDALMPIKILESFRAK